MDGVRGTGSSFVTIASNTFTDFRPNSTDHPDAIQFWTYGSTASATDIVIKDNVFTRGTGQYALSVHLTLQARRHE